MARSGAQLSPRSSGRAISPASSRRPGGSRAAGVRAPRRRTCRWPDRGPAPSPRRIHAPRTSPTIGSERSSWRRSWSTGSLRRTFSSTPSRSKISRLRSAITAESGWPPNVIPWRSEDPGLIQRLGDSVGDEHGAHRGVGRGEALGDGREIGDHALALDAEPLPEPAEAADHLVGRTAAPRTRRRSRADPASSPGARAGSRPRSGPARR